MTITYEIPVKTISENNRSRHEHWGTTRRRAARQRAAAMLFTNAAMNGDRMAKSVLITRVAPRFLDTDNLVGATKHLQDGIADALGINDRNMEWRYAQRQRKGKPPTVEVAIEFQGE